MTAPTPQHRVTEPGVRSRAPESSRTSAPDRYGAPLSAAAMRWTRSVLADTVPALATGLIDVRMLRDGPKQLAVLDFTTVSALVLKQYADDRGAWTRRWLQRLTEAGLAAPARFTVTPARGWSAAHRTLVTDLATGQPWADWTLAPAADRDAAAVAAADWLTRLQSLPVALPDRTGYRAGEELRRETGRLAIQYPSHAPRLFRVADTAHGLLYGDPHAAGPDLVASHGDLHPNNLYLAAGGPLTVTAIDVDTAGLRRPSYDVGYALAQLLILSWLHTGSFQCKRGSSTSPVPPKILDILLSSMSKPACRLLHLVRRHTRTWCGWS